MKSKIILFSGISLIILTLSTFAIIILGEKGFNPHTLKNTYINLTGKSVNVIFIGNSITENWSDYDPSFFRSNNYVNRGSGGERTHHLLSRFREDVLNLQPKIVIISGGVNDISHIEDNYDPELTYYCILAMIRAAQDEDIKIILSSILPAKAFPWNPRILDAPEKIIAMNNRIKKYADENNISYVDYHSAMVAEDGGMLANYTKDGVHPTLEGYKVMEPLIKKAIDSLLEK